MKQVAKQLMHRIRRWRKGVAVEWYQDGNTVYVWIRRYGLFKQYSGIPFFYKIDIDPTLTTQSSRRYDGVDCSYWKSSVMRAMRFFISKIQLWCDKTSVVVGWHRDGDTIYLKIQRCGLLNKYKGTPIVCDIDINTTPINQSP